MRRALPLFLTCTLLAACAEDPFVEHYSRSESMAAQSYVQKEETMVSRTGRGEVCFAGPTPAQEVQQTARDACAEFGLQAIMDGVERYQCRLTNPHVAHFHCVDPSMRTEQGDYVNVFNPRAVAAWEKRTGQKAPLRQAAGAYMARPQRQGETAPAPTLPSFAPEGRPLVPADKSAVPPGPESPQAKDPGMSPVAPALTPPVASPPLVPFTLPAGSWGDHF